METKTYSVTNVYEPTLSSEDWQILQGARFAALPQAVQSTIRALNISDGAQLVFQDLFALAVRDRFEGNLAVQRPRHRLESLSNKTRSTYSRVLKELERAGLIVRRMTRHPATRYAQGWTVIFIQLPTETWNAMRDDQYRSYRPQQSNQATSSPNYGGHDTTNVSSQSDKNLTNQPAPSTEAPITSSQTSQADPNRNRDDTRQIGPQNDESQPGHADRVEVQSQTDTASNSGASQQNGSRDSTIDTPTEVVNDPLNTAKDAYQLWITSKAAAECRVAPTDVVKPICRALMGIELAGHETDRQTLIRDRLQNVPEASDITHDELARALASQSIHRSTPNKKAQNNKTPQPTCIPSDLVQAIKDRAAKIGIEETNQVFEIAYSVYCGVFQWHESRDRAIGSALKVIRKGQWQTPFGFDVSQCRSQHDGSVVLTA